VSWQSLPLKRLCDVSREIVDPHDLVDESVFLYSLPAWHEIGDGRSERVEEIASAKLALRGGEVLVSKLNPEKDVVIHVVSNNERLLCSPELIALEPRRADGRFIYYLMQSARVRASLRSSVESVTNSHKRARVDKFLASHVSVPDLDTQKAIAAFLDRETARIDQLIEKKQRLVALLEEKEFAKIRLAVSGYLQPDVRFGSTRNDWISSLPEHWEIRPLRRVAFFQRGHDLPVDSREEGPVAVIGSGGLSGYHSAPQAKAPGIVTGRYGTIGTFHYIDDDYWPLNTTLYTKRIFEHPRFVWYTLRAMSYLFVLNSLKSAVPGVDRNDLHFEYVPVPPRSEQIAIASYLDQSSESFRKASHRIAETIDRLREFRAALITAAVTGRIDPATWRRRGDTDRRLHRIDEALAS